MKDWHEQFDKEFLKFCLENNIVFLGNYDEEKDSIKDFVSNLIEQVINDIPKGCGYLTCDVADCIEPIKQQLRDKYLN